MPLALLSCISPRLRLYSHLSEVILCCVCCAVRLVGVVQGLVEQMLAITVASEAPDLEVQSEQLRREIADYGKLVADMEDKVLELLSGDVNESLLDDESVITTLSVRLESCFVIAQNHGSLTITSTEHV